MCTLTPQYNIKHIFGAKFLKWTDWCILPEGRLEYCNMRLVHCTDIFKYDEAYFINLPWMAFATDGDQVMG